VKVYVVLYIYIDDWDVVCVTASEEKAVEYIKDAQYTTYVECEVEDLEDK